MSRYIQTIIFLIVFIFAGCAQKGVKINKSKQFFEGEDYLVLSALDYQRNNHPKNAIKLYKILYEKSKKMEYLVEATKVSFLSNQKQTTYALVKKGLKIDPKNVDIRRVLIGQYMKEKQYKLAKNEALSLLKDEKNSKNLKIVGTIYMQLKSYNLALKYFESAYKIKTDANTLLNITDIQYNFLNKKDEAISYLETHIRIKGCQLNTCFKLVELYGKEKNIDGIISTYKKLFEKFPDEKYAKRIVQLFMYKKDKVGAIKFLETSGYNQELLLSIYLSSHNFKEAYTVAEKLYKSTSNIDYLGKMAIYEYESNKDMMDKQILKSVSKKFDKVISKLHDPLYLNYYGYLLIDHDINVQRGIGLVEEALLREPNSAFFLDSIAWGYYKQKKCKKAKKIMDKIIQNTREKEVIMHYNKINKCLKKTAHE